MRVTAVTWQEGGLLRRGEAKTEEIPESLKVFCLFSILLTEYDN